MNLRFWKNKTPKATPFYSPLDKNQLDQMTPAEAHLPPQYQKSTGGCGSKGCGSGDCHSTQENSQDHHSHNHSHSHSHDHGHSHEYSHSDESKQNLNPTPEALKNVTNIIAIASGKGGVGKSTVATQLAFTLNSKGAKVGLLDADIYGPSQPKMLGALDTRGKTNSEGLLIPSQKNGISFVSVGNLVLEDRAHVWRGPIAGQMIQQFLGNVAWGNLDYLFIDLPPGTGDVQLTLAQSVKLTGAVIVTTPQEIAVGIAKKGLQMFRELHVPILGIIENMSGFTCTHCNHETAIFKDGGGETLSESQGVPLLGKIPLDPKLMLSSDLGDSILNSAPSSHAANAMKAIGDTLIIKTKTLRSDKQSMLSETAENLTV